MLEKREIEDKLLEIGLNPALTGFNMIVSAMQLLDMGYTGWNSIYETIGKDLKINLPAVLRAMGRSFDWARNNVNGNYDKVEHYIGFEHEQMSCTLMRLYKMLLRDHEDREHAYVQTCDEEYIKGIVLSIMKNIILGAGA